MIRRVREEPPERSKSRGHALLINITVVHANGVSIRTKGKRKTENKQGKLDQDAITGWELTEKEWLLNSDNVLLLGQLDKLS